MARRHADDMVFYATIGIIVGGRLGYRWLAALVAAMAPTTRIVALEALGSLLFHAALGWLCALAGGAAVTQWPSIKMWVTQVNARGGPKDHAQAQIWFTKAAEKGHVGSLFALGALLGGGHDVPAPPMLILFGAAANPFFSALFASAAGVPARPALAPALAKYGLMRQDVLQ